MTWLGFAFTQLLGRHFIIITNIIVLCLRDYWTVIWTLSIDWFICIHIRNYLFIKACMLMCVCVSRHACMHCVTIWFVCMHLYRNNSLICLASLGWSDASDISDGRTRCSSRSVCRFATPVWRNRTQTTSLSSHTHWRGKWAILYRECHATYPHWCLLS